MIQNFPLMLALAPRSRFVVFEAAGGADLVQNTEIPPGSTGDSPPPRPSWEVNNPLSAARELSAQGEI